MTVSATIAQAVPTTVTFLDTPKCDVLSVPNQVDELGTNGFPINEMISSQFVGTTPQTACAMNAGLYTGFLVSITNLSGINWGQVWYVANTETAIVNDDGLVNQEESFLINNAAGDLNNVWRHVGLAQEEAPEEKARNEDEQQDDERTNDAAEPVARRWLIVRRRGGLFLRRLCLLRMRRGLRLIRLRVIVRHLANSR